MYKTVTLTSSEYEELDKNKDLFLYKSKVLNSGVEKTHLFLSNDDLNCSNTYQSGSTIYHREYIGKVGKVINVEADTDSWLDEIKMKIKLI